MMHRFVLGLAALGGLAAVPALGQPTRVEVRLQDTSAQGGRAVRSVSIRAAELVVERARHRMELENVRARLAAGSPEPPSTERERRELEARLASTRSALARIESELSVVCSRSGVTPGTIGAMGIYSAAPNAVDPAMRPYPVVKVVEPGTPAARAGITADDTIIAINGMDARTQRLESYLGEPGRRLTLRLARAGGRRDVSVLVEQRPSTFTGRCFTVSQSGDNIFVRLDTMPAVETPRAIVRGGRGSPSSGSRGSAGAAATRSAMVDSSRDMLNLGVFRAMTGSIVGSGRGAVVAGADVFMLNEGLKQAMGVGIDGALVLTVLRGSPAAVSGLIPGDIIVRAGTQPLTSVLTLQRGIQQAANRSVELEIVREKARRTLILRW
jgi:S1-C subfamily serine protease